MGTVAGNCPRSPGGNCPRPTFPCPPALGAAALAYRRLAAAAAEATETGWFRAANERFEREAAAIEERFGGSATGRRLRRAAFERVWAAEQAYWERCTEPTQRAAVALALTPAPDLAAVRAKIGAMRAVDLDELGSMPRPCLDLLEEDVRRLSGRI